MEQKDLNQLHKEAQKFRKKKVEEVFNKKNPSEMELRILSKWAEHYGEEIYDRDTR